MENKRYTAQEIRRVAEFVEFRDTGAIVTNCVIAAMLRQAADAEDELEKVKARLETIVKECENTQLAYKGMEAKIFADSLVSAVDAILRAARGESEMASDRTTIYVVKAWYSGWCEVIRTKDREEAVNTLEETRAFYGNVKLEEVEDDK